MEDHEGYLQENLTRKHNDESRTWTKERSLLMHAPAHELKMEVHLEDALDIAGVGRYQLFHWALMLMMLLAAMLEMIGIAFVLPAATCDLDIPDGLRGILTSIPNIGIILTAPFWGRAADFYGRKPVLLLSAAAAGLLALVAALMPSLLSFAICKLAASMFLSCPSSLTIAYACELMPRRHRDRTVLLCNGLLMLLSTLSPVFAWAVLSSEWRFTVGTLIIRPWRLLTVVYALPLLLTTLWLTAAEESPKFLMTKGRDRDALDVLKRVYVWNGGQSEDSFGVKSLALSDWVEGAVGLDGAARAGQDSAWALLRAPHLKWLALTGFLMFGLFSLLNGLFLLAPDTINKVMSGAGGDEGTVCTLINQPDDNTTISSTCQDTISHDTFYIMMVTTLVYGVLVTAVSISPLSKKTQLVAMYAGTSNTCQDTISHDTFYIMMVTTLVYGVLVTAVSISPLSKKTQLVAMYAGVSAASLISAFTTNRIVAGVAMSALQVTALGIGPLTAYAVRLFPTTLRGTAVGAVMMFGRVGSAAGANTAGYFLADACAPTFYGFTVLTLLCAALSFLLPGDHSNAFQGSK